MTLYEAIKQRLGGPRRRARAPDDELPQRAVDPGRGQRRLRRADAREPGRQPGVVRAARALTATIPSGQPSRRRAPVPRPYSDFGQSHELRHRRRPCPTPSGRSSTGSSQERLDGHRARAPRRSRSPSKRATSASCSRRFVSGSDEDLTRAYVRALEARRVPHVLVGGRSFHAREEVVALRNALTAIEWPDDELSVFATLRGPFFALSRRRAPRVPAQDRGSARTRSVRSTPTRSTTSRSRSRRRSASCARCTSAATAAPSPRPWRGSSTSRARTPGIAIWPTGEQALANVLRVLDQARRFEAAGATSFRAFVEWLEEEAERGRRRARRRWSRRAPTAFAS